MDDYAIESMLGHLEQQNFASHAEGLAAIAGATRAINEAWLADRDFGATGFVGEDRERRLRQWIERLLKIVRNVVDAFTDVSGYSISVSFPAGVGVTVNFDRPVTTGVASFR